MGQSHNSCAVNVKHRTHHIWKVGQRDRASDRKGPAGNFLSRRGASLVHFSGSGRHSSMSDGEHIGHPWRTGECWNDGWITKRRRLGISLADMEINTNSHRRNRHLVRFALKFSQFSPALPRPPSILGSEISRIVPEDMFQSADHTAAFSGPNATVVNIKCMAKGR
jgi:hypothetical protein